MNEKYIEFFIELTRAVAVSAESVMEYDHSKNDEQGERTAKTLRDDFQAMHERIKKAGNAYVPTKNDIARLLVGALVTSNQLLDRINNLKKALSGYQTDILPKLQEIMDKATTDEEVAILVGQKFIINQEETNT